jgi:Ni/Co efflux regulator RcnB
MNNPTRFLVVICSLALLAAGSHSPNLAAKDKGKPDKAGNSQKHDKDDDFDVDIDVSGMITAGISIGDARQVAQRYQLTGAKPLPPGIRKNLARGKPLPPGIAKKSMPVAFINELPHHDGYEWHQAGSDLVLVASASLVVSDVLKGVFD